LGKKEKRKRKLGSNLGQFGQLPFDRASVEGVLGSVALAASAIFLARLAPRVELRRQRPQEPRSPRPARSLETPPRGGKEPRGRPRCARSSTSRHVGRPTGRSRRPGRGGEARAASAERGMCAARRSRFALSPLAGGTMRQPDRRQVLGGATRGVKAAPCRPQPTWSLTAPSASLPPPAGRLR
jgi:hypothetical protein